MPARYFGIPSAASMTGAEAATSVVMMSPISRFRSSDSGSRASSLVPRPVLDGCREERQRVHGDITLSLVAHANFEM